MVRGIIATTLTPANEVSPCPTTASWTSSDDEESVPVPATAMAIPRFRSARPPNASYDEIEFRRRRTVSNYSAASTSTSSSRSSVSSVGRASLFDDDDALMNDLSVVVPPRLPPAPYPVDPYHFYCRANDSEPATLAQEIRSLLVECNIEFLFQPCKCKFKCVKHVQYSHVEFIIRVYATANGVLLLEFQRRSGSLLLWDGLYSVLYNRLARWADPIATACPQSGTQKKVSPDSLSVRVWNKLSTSVHTPTSGVEAMKIMITSPHFDAQVEGYSGLAAITENAESAYLVAKFGIVEHLVTAAASEDHHMARCAIGALGNISRAVDSFPDEKVAAQTVDLLKHTARVVVARLGTTTDSLFSLELLRECARALGSFGKVCPHEVVGCEGLLQLKHHMNHRDHQLAALCREALHELETTV